MPPANSRQVLSLDAGWRFELGDPTTPVPRDKHIAAYMANKAGWSRGPARPGFDDSDWRVVDLPHDWSVEGKIDRNNYLDNGFLPRGVGWYRRYFQLDESDRGKYLALNFDGVATHATVYVNGHLLHRNFCGYTPFTVDISDVANFGEQINVIAVFVDAAPIEGWWYEGAGIYRHVELIKSPRIRTAAGGLFVSTKRKDGEVWHADVRFFSENASDEKGSYKIDLELIDPRGETVTRSDYMIQYVSPGYPRLGGDTLIVHHPSLWSIDSPSLYTMRLRLWGGDSATNIFQTLLEQQDVSVGFRTIRFDADQGFFLNDRPLKLKGACIHQDHAGVGVAVPDSIAEFRIRRLKEMGCNAIRTAHHPPARALLDACDRLGMLVMDENRNFGSSPQHFEQLRAMVERDRNHPSVICWSLSNEEAIQGTPVANAITKSMQAYVKRLDPTRPVTAAVSGGILNDDSQADAIEVMGINYQLPLHDQYHAKHPEVPLIAAETHCTLSTRGVYKTVAEKFHFAAYDNDTAPWGATARQTWREVSSRPFIAGLFLWTGFDYRGEPSPHGWPCVNSHFGMMDTCGFAKDSFYLHKAWFDPQGERFIHLLPHWNGHAAGEPVRVMAYTNCDEVELFLNGRSLGRKPVDPIEMVEWSVPYEPGELKAVGAPTAEAIVRTTGPATSLGLKIHPDADAQLIPADGAFALPITVFATDERGQRVPDADPHATFAIEGPAKILGVGNGDPTCHEPDKASARSLFNGLGQVIVQTTATAGMIRLTASSPGLKSATLEIHSTPASVHPALAPATVRHFISDWRMSPVAANRPDPNQEIAAADMNSWERIDPARGAQSAWGGASGYAIYRAVVALPRRAQVNGGELVFHAIAGAAEVFLDRRAVAAKPQAASASLRVTIPPGLIAPVTISVLIYAASVPAGLTQSVEILPA